MTFLANLEKTERILAYCNKQASSGQTVDPKAFRDLTACAQALQSDVGTALSESEGIHEANCRMAEAVLDTNRKTAALIQEKVQMGKSFDHVRASARVASIIARLSSLCASTSMTDPKVHAQLSQMASQATSLYQLFHPRS